MERGAISPTVHRSTTAAAFNASQFADKCVIPFSWIVRRYNLRRRPQSEAPSPCAATRGEAHCCQSVALRGVACAVVGDDSTELPHATRSLARRTCGDAASTLRRSDVPPTSLPKPRRDPTTVVDCGVIEDCRSWDAVALMRRPLPSPRPDANEDPCLISVRRFLDPPPLPAVDLDGNGDGS